VYIEACKEVAGLRDAVFGLQFVNALPPPPDPREVKVHAPLNTNL
jgi:hypothetical protein